MTKLVKYFFRVILLVTLSVVGNSALAKDRIKIISISPESVTDSGVETEFIIEVEYKIISEGEGVIYWGFNSKEPKRFSMVQRVHIEENEGRITLKAKG